MRRSALTLIALAGVAVVPVSSAVAGGPAATKPVPVKRKCDPNYRGACLKPNVSDYDCKGGSGNGPYYVRGPIKVVGKDHYGLDADGDGVGCE